MTEKLKQLMHERAGAVDFASPDLDRMSRTGDRRRRTRNLAVVGGAAALAVAAALVVPSLGGEGERAVDPATGTPDTAVVSWATGHVIHAGEQQIDVGHTVNAYVRTRTGYVFADPGGTVWSWSGDDSTEVGRTDARLPRLVSDGEGTLAGWVDASGDRPAFVVLDQATGEVHRYDEHTTAGMATAADVRDPAYFYGIDERTAYWRDTRGAVAVDLDTGTARVVDAEARSGFAIGAVENGLIAFTNRGGGGTVIGKSLDQTVELTAAYGTLGAFSSDARWYSSEGDVPSVHDVRTGEQVQLQLTEKFASGYEWLDDSTLVLIAADRPSDSDQAKLMTCTVPAGDCQVVVPDLGTFNELADDDFALPVGEAIGS